MGKKSKLRLFQLMIFLCVQMGLFSGGHAQTHQKVKIGLSVWTGYPSSVQGFKDAMAKGGFIEGDNTQYLYGKSDGDEQKQQKILTRFKQAGVDLVYSLTTSGTILAKQGLPAELPIVFSIVTYPADSGLIESFEYSGNNLVGTSNYVPLTYYVKLLKAILPQARSVAIFHRQGEPNSKIQAANLTRQLRRAGIDVLDKEATDISQLKEMALEIVDSVDLFITTTDTLMQSGGEEVLIEISLQKKIPILSSNKKGIEQGATFGPVADFYTLGKMSGQKAVQILRDNIEPTRMESELQEPPLFLVNRSSLQKIGIKPPKTPSIQLKWTE